MNGRKSGVSSAGLEARLYGRQDARRHVGRVATCATAFTFVSQKST
jgi:hypothetical protein